MRITGLEAHYKTITNFNSKVWSLLWKYIPTHVHTHTVVLYVKISVTSTVLKATEIYKVDICNT